MVFCLQAADQRCRAPGGPASRVVRIAPFVTGQMALDGVAESIVLADIESVCASLTSPGSPPALSESAAAVAKAGDLDWAQRTSRANAPTARNLMITGPTACVLSRDRVRSPVQTQDAI